MKSMELLTNELAKHNLKVTELQARLQQIQVSQKQLEMDREDAERELSFEAGVLSSLEFAINLVQQELVPPQPEAASKK